MTSEDLDERKRTLENSIDSLGSWMIGFTWPVAIGLLMEFYAILNSPWTVAWNVLIDRIGLLLVTAGVIGELLIEHKTHHKERKLREIDAEIERQAELKLKSADERIASLLKEGEEARLARIKAETDFLQLKESLKDRTISPTQKELLLSSLAECPKGPLVISCMVEESDAHPLALELQRIFLEAGWTSVPIEQVLAGVGAGIFIGIQDAAQEPEHAEFLLSAFASAGITLGTYSDKRIPAGTVRILIGRKARRV